MARSHRFASLAVRLGPALPVALVCVLAGAVSAQFGGEHLIATSNVNLRDLHAADLDGDGDLDVLAALQFTPVLVWYRNLGGGVFGNAITVLPPDPFYDVSGIAVDTLDFDHDGDPDVLVALSRYHPSVGPHDEVEVWRNAGDGSFTWAWGYSIPQFGSVAGLDVADLEGDEDADICFGNSGNDSVFVVRGTTSGMLLSPAVVAADVFAAKQILLQDLDGDVDSDLIVTSATGDSITWYENTGGLPFGPEQVISATANGAGALSAADLDGDGDVDVVAEGASSGVSYLRWYANQGGGRFEEHSIAIGSTHPQSVMAADLDADDDADLLLSEISGLAWYANDGQGQFGPRQAIGGPTLLGVEAVAADLDGDTVPDVLAGSNPAFARIAWYPSLLTAPWTNLLSGLEGLLGVPSLVGTGTLETGSPGSLVLSAATPSSPGLLVTAIGSTPTPFKCGTLVPVPVLLGFPVLTGPTGSIPLAWSAWPNAPSGLSLYFQYAIMDAAAPCGVSLSNALRADLP